MSLTAWRVGGRTVTAMFEPTDPATAFLTSLGLSPDDDSPVAQMLRDGVDEIVDELDEIELDADVIKKWRRFGQWCEERGLDPYQCPTSDVAAFLEDIGRFRRDARGRIVKVGRSGSMLSNALRAIGRMRARAGLANISTCEELRRVCRTASQMGPRQVRVAPALTFEAAEALLYAPPVRTIEAQNRAVLLASHFGKVPLTALSRLERDDFRIDTGGVVITASSFGRIHLPAHPVPELDPVSAFETVLGDLPAGQQLVLGAKGSFASGPDLTSEKVSWETEWNRRIPIRLSERLHRAANVGGVDGWTVNGYAGAGCTEGDVRRVSVWLSYQLVDWYRDRAIILGALHLRLRPGEVVILDSVRMTRTTEGLLVDLPRSKTNQDGGRRETRGAVFHRDPKLCGARAVIEWAELRGLRIRTPFEPPSGGLLFGPAYPTDPHVVTTPTVVSDIIRRRSQIAGLDTVYTGYSPRRGAAQIMAEKGASADDIRRALAHRRLGTQTSYRDNPDLEVSRADLKRLAE